MVCENVLYVYAKMSATLFKRFVFFQLRAADPNAYYSCDDDFLPARTVSESDQRVRGSQGTSLEIMDNGNFSSKVASNIEGTECTFIFTLMCGNSESLRLTWRVAPGK